MAGQSDPQFSSFSPSEMEFLAEDEIVGIIPNMRMEPINLISGDYGPFRPHIATQVPVWLEVALKKRGKCTIRPPVWMTVDRPREFQPLPFHYVEISKLLFGE